MTEKLYNISEEAAKLWGIKERQPVSRELFDLANRPKPDQLIAAQKAVAKWLEEREDND